MNGDITDKEVRLIGENGEQLGVMSSREANRLADEAGLDLVKISPNAVPPVCKIMDYGKYKYETEKRAKEARKKQKTFELKEIRVTPNIEEHDFGFKSKNARKFIEDGSKVKITVRFRGRELNYVKLGEEALNKELRKRKIIFSDFLTNENMDKIIKELKYTNFDEVYINIGNNKLAIGAVINIVTGENNTKEDIILRKTQNKEVILPSVKTDIIVEGIEDIKVNVASCCKPVPGDRIIGYITKGYGISVHRLACPNVKDLEERTISVRWNEVINKKYPTNLIIKTLKNDNLLLDIIAKTSNNNLTIQSIYNYNSKGDNTYDITVLVDNKENLKKFMAEVDSISSVTLCERHIK